MFGGKRGARVTPSGWTVFCALCCWVIFSPLRIIPRRRDWMVVIGREDGKFIDNAKYFFLSAAKYLEGSTRVVFVTERSDVVHLLRDSHYEVRHFPTRSSIWLLLRAGTVVVDSVDWTRHGRSYLLLGAKSIQLWHGVGYKRIELDLWKHTANKYPTHIHRVLRLWLCLASSFLTARLYPYDAVISTSVFYRDNVFKKAFISCHYFVCGYPRNAFNNIPQDTREAVWLNADKAIARRARDWLRDARRVVLIAPTFRDSGAPPILLTPEDLAMLDAWCAEFRVEMIFKLHPFDKNTASIQGRHLHLSDPNSDLYPLMPMSSALITDHSSIYMDYLHLNKPILFLTNTWNFPASLERQFQFDPAGMTPGMVASSWPALLGNLKAELEADTYQEARAELKRLAFDNISQELAVESIIKFMRVQRWIPST